jgi:hypothetical protein
MIAIRARKSSGIVAEIEAFSGGEAEMRQQVEKFHVDYVAVCPSSFRGAERPLPASSLKGAL